VVREIVQAVTQCSDPQQYGNLSVPPKQRKDGLSLAQGLVEKRGSGVRSPVHGRPSVQPRPKRLNGKTFPGAYYPPRGRRQDLTEDVWCAQKRARGKNLSIGVVNVRQHCV
jgi:hypothetical protein